MFRSQKTSIAAHVIGWLLFLGLPLLFVTQQSGVDTFAISIISPRSWLFLLVYMLVFYLNTNYLIPQLYFRRKIALYLVCLAIGLVSIFYLQPFERLIYHPIEMQRGRPPVMPNHPALPPDNQYFRQPPPMPPSRQSPKTDIISIFLFGTVWALGMAMRTSEQWRLTEKRVFRAEAERANAELSFLKAQINPHFLFNTLNNIYSMAVTNNPNTAASVMKLSNIMRYVTDEVNEDFVPLQSEIECIKDYVDLQRLRLNKKTAVDFEVSGKIDYQIITPLVLMTFVENAFKHGVSNRENSEISIEVNANDQEISFTCKNTLFATPRNVERTGIGLKNTEQRLLHLYPNRHSLQVSADNGHYCVKLVVQNKP